MGGTGNRLDHLYSGVLHVLYLIVGMITTLFIGAPTCTRVFLLVLVPTNLAAKYNHGDSAALNFPSMTVLIFASAAGSWMHITIMLYLICNETWGFWQWWILQLHSSGIWCHVVSYKVSQLSEEPGACILKVPETACYSKVSVLFFHTTQHDIPQDYF
jgi:hypothetical protein